MCVMKRVADYLWTFQSGKVVKGKVVEPVAVETCLGWVLSGSMKGRDVDGSVKCQFCDAVKGE